MKPSERLMHIREAWGNGRLNVASLTLGLDQVFHEARDYLSPDDASEARSQWNRIEVFNAILLDEYRPPTAEEKQELDRLVDEFRTFIRERLPEGR
ncbi:MULTISPECIES: hypothetical protein [unclassified Actinobaculum]|uniref:hypothetical protein n=1 Tax=unclassified Actinobaculum TaxID=2609299 RepID=UPI000D529D04|nr:MULTISPECIES: hypothetical protein [unclassified Actinobaculum]AWE42790.1 hypothetical protein DDD63_08580 [Actinobaculum sp. 313]RTE49600.1 hypothetical protein EKN07_06030 [Actinobaculum sp. 352]